MRYSKLIVSVVVGMSLTVNIGSAADLGSRPYSNAPVYVQSGFGWAGIYIGANVGYSWGTSSDTSTLNAGAGPALFTDIKRSKMDGVVGGGQIGYNWQVQNWLLGVEGDFQGTGQRDIHSSTCPTGVCTAVFVGVPPILLPGPALPVSLSQQLDWFGTARVRGGFLVSPTVLLYATGGLAYGQVDSRSTILGATTSNIIRPGWTVGAGVEGVIVGDWTARLEYLYVDLGRVSDTFNSALVAPDGTSLVVSNFNSHITDNIVRVGFNYKFSGSSIAKY
jgi:outer membrane immunogenic protein